MNNHDSKKWLEQIADMDRQKWKKEMTEEIKHTMKEVADSIKEMVASDAGKDAEIRRLKIEIVDSDEEIRGLKGEIDENIVLLHAEIGRLKAENKQLKDEMAGKCCGNCEYRLCSHWKKKEAVDVRCANCVDRYKLDPVPTRCQDCLDPTGELKYPYFRPKKKE